MADFIAEYTDTPEIPTNWNLYVDGSSNKIGSGAGVIIESNQGTQIELSLKFKFPASNSQAEYEMLLAGLKLAKEVGAQKLVIFSDSQVTLSWWTLHEDPLKYNGLPGEDLLKHLKDFQVACATARRHGVDESAVLVFAFPLSLEGKAKEWFYTQLSEIRSNWDLLHKDFLEKFYPPQKTDMFRREISCIVQQDGKILYEYWERFKKLLEACPHHQIDELVLISYFCQGMQHQDKLLLDAASGGSLTKNKTTTEAWEVISDLADSTQHSRARTPHPKALSEVSPSRDAILTKTLSEMTILLRQITQGQKIPQALINAPPQPPRIEEPPRICVVCACTTHYTDECPQIQEDTTLAVANPYPQRTNYNQGPYQHGGNQNQGWRDNSNQRLNQAPQANLTKILKPITPNTPKGSINGITLRSGTKLDKNVDIPAKASEKTNNDEVGEEVEMTKGEDENVDRSEEEPPKVKEPKRKTLLEEPSPIPFPTLVKKAKKQEDLDPTLVEVFKKVEVTIPLFQAIQQVPKYAKFLKYVCTHKDKLGNVNKKPVDDSISSLLPEKYNDPSPCLVTCLIGGIKFMDCMCDLEACVSTMPLPVYQRLNLPPLKRSGARFVLADKSIVSVVEIAENVIINIQWLLFPVDFHILETLPINSTNPSSILLGRPFLKTARFKLDAHSGVYSFESDGELVKFTLEESNKPTLKAYSIFGHDIVEDKVIEDVKEQEKEEFAKKSNSKDHAQPKNAKELEIFLLGEVSK
ncbi:uncharacterized protein LOC130957175 [Arachis stenosperma]|uniref:uncharacterized protein LOC130957175 n=1 Tax=Arachis stenosperma TaxID=217475 RepID=UPI0025ABD255|nr:uncharacterized protein LOC130957175 [Arachis stenosperma]